VSNVSFGLSREARAVLNSVFLYHCVQAGLDMAIVNPADVIPYAEIDAEDRRLADDLVFNRSPEALANYIARFEGARPDGARRRKRRKRRRSRSSSASTTRSCTGSPPASRRSSTRP
jgi:5-methyltetrahydrofolate--homocysteine methyltransferase